MADPDFELRRGPGSILLAQPGFSPSVISSFFSCNHSLKKSQIETKRIGNKQKSLQLQEVSPCAAH